ELDLGTVQPSLAGPKRPQDRVLLTDAKPRFITALGTEFKKEGEVIRRVPVEGRDFDLGHGDVVIAAITSCTNTSNPYVMIGAGLLARKALEKGLDGLGFNLVGFGCTTCIGNSGPLPEEISAAISAGDLVAAAVLSGNRNFEGRINPDVRANYL